MRSPDVAVSVIDPNDAYRYLEFRGQVQIIEADPDNVVLNRLAEKYLGARVYPWDKTWEMLTVVRVFPNKLFGAR